MFTGDVFGSKDYHTGLGIYFDTYSNHNGPHNVSSYEMEKKTLQFTGTLPAFTHLG